MRALTIVLLSACLFPALAMAQPCPTCTPLEDLAGPPHRGLALGLYGPGTNLPTASHRALADAAGLAVVPRDAAGSPSPHGLIGMLSIGMSNTNQEFSPFERGDDIRPGRNPRLVVVNGAVGGQSADIIQNPAAPYWTTVMQRVAAAGLDADQVQVAWLKQADGAVPDTTFPAHAETLHTHLERIVTGLRVRFPQLRLVYLSSRIYGGYSTNPQRSEPLSFETGFAVRWLIERQMAGDPALNPDPGAGPVTAPVLLWGPYLWANGTTPRASDGLAWLPADLEVDAIHPSPSGEAKVAQLLAAFLAGESSAAPWRDAATGEWSVPRDAEADSYVDLNQPMVVHGADPEIAWSNPNARAFIRFDLGGLPPGQLLHAKLSLMGGASNAFQLLEVAGVSNDGWNEATMEGSTVPLIDGGSLGFVPTASRGTAASLDLTHAVSIALAAGDPKLTIALRALSGPTGLQRVLSREGGGTPRLVLGFRPATLAAPAASPAATAQLRALDSPVRGTAAFAVQGIDPRTETRLEVLDVRGRRLATLHHGALAAGEHRFEWGDADAAAGLYWARLVAVREGRTLASARFVRLGP
jgi:hypothetical protein